MNRSILISLSITLVLIFVSVISLFFFIVKPPLLSDLSFSQAVYDDQHHLLRLTLSADQQYRVFTPLKKISPELVEATLLQEDQYFFWHVGINPYSIIKAAWQTYFLHAHRMGASTLSMQVARIRFHLNSKTWYGKIWQILRALQLEMHYSKNQILEAYLNLAPYGNNIEGVGAASLIYFGNSAKELTLPQSLILAVIPQNPNQRNFNNPHLKTIRHHLFARWVHKHPVDNNMEKTLDLPLQMQGIHTLPFYAPHFVNSVLKTTSPHEHAVITTLDLHLQTILERVTHQYLNRTRNKGIYNAAVMLVDARDHSIKGLVGSADFFNAEIEGQIDGTVMKRSPGSTLKPFIYGLALDQGLIHPNTILKDVRRSYGHYNPENFDYDFMGPIKAKDALVLSRNIPALYLSSLLSHPDLYQFLQQAHIAHLKSQSYYGLALTLGGAELTMRELSSLYAMLINDGMWHSLRMREEDPIQSGERLLSPEASFLVLDMLKNTPKSIHALLNDYSLSISWKTGTSSGFRDAWSIGVFGPYVLSVWIGNFDNTGNPALVGKDIAAPLFFEIIEAIQHENGTFPILKKKPNQYHLTQIDVCRASGMLPTHYCRDTEKTWFIPGKSPIKVDTIYREIAIDKKTGLRTCHIDQNTRFAIYEFWSSDLLTIFKKAGIQRRTPPAFDASCTFLNTAGTSPEIISPESHVSYMMHASLPTQIPLSTIADADVKTVYWFINNTYLAKTLRDQSLLWSPKPGKYSVRVVDDHGRSNSINVAVKLALS